MSPSEEDPREELLQRLAEWNMGLEELQSRVDRAEAGKHAKLNERLRRLREDYDTAAARLAEAPDPEADTWDEFREGLTRARELLDEAVEESDGSEA